MKTKTVLLVLALIGGVVIASPAPASAATSNTPVWIGAGFAGSYMNHTRPGTHGGNQVAFDYYALAGTTVSIYAAPKNAAYNNQITAHIVDSNASSMAGGAAKCGYYALVEIRHSGKTIGRVYFGHLAAKASLGTINRWGGKVGKVAELPLNQPDKPGACYVVSRPTGRHSHIEFRSSGSRPACAHDYGAVSVPATKYQGYIGDYGKAPLKNNVCPKGI